MSNAITEFLKKLSTDNTFREFAQTQPDSAISSFTMTSDEKRAVKSLLEKSDDKDFGTRAGTNRWWQA